MKNITFPTLYELKPNFATLPLAKQIREYLRYYIRLNLFRAEIKILIDFLNNNPHWQQIFCHDLYRFNALLATFCDKRFNAKQRLAAIIDNFTEADQLMPNLFWQQLVSQKSIKLAQLNEEYGLFLNINQIDPFEGFFSINIQNHQGQHFYDASFCFLNSKRLLISSIQGPKGKDAQEQVKLLTKSLYGIRPMFMLMIGLKLLAEHWQLALVGIPHQYQAKYRFNDSSRLLFNYDEFWQENNGKLQHRYWNLPLDIERKSLDEIQSKKRSMYRKRYEMLDQLTLDIQQQLQAVKFNQDFANG